MKEKDKLIDFPGYDPTLEHLPFPPSQEDYKNARQSDEIGVVGSHLQGEAPPPYNETYVAEVPTPDPAQTTPGQPNIRDIDAPELTPEQLKALSPGNDLKE